MPQSGEITPRRSLAAVEMYRIRQCWEQPTVTDLAASVAEELAKAGALARIRPGDEIAITAGSRGIACMPDVLRAIVGAVRAREGVPFIFPAMGSHGGGTAEGQREMLAGMGIDESTMGAPIRATMDVVQLGETPEGVPVYLDAYAAQADGIILTNRIKKHTNYDGPFESGLCKMSVIGMGKHMQAVAVHQHGNYGLREYIPSVARVVYDRAPVLAGVAILENARGGVAELVGLAADQILEREPALLLRAKDLCAKIPFHDVDIAIVERMGKDISGTGMDCYVIGRKRIIGEPEWPEATDIRSLVVLDLTKASHGNAVGVGLADFTTRRLVDQIHWAAMEKNILTSGNMERGKVPLAYDTDRDAIETASFRERMTPIDALRIVCLQDTLHMEKLLVSSVLAREAQTRSDLEVLDGPMPLPLDSAGMWRSP